MFLRRLMLFLGLAALIAGCNRQAAAPPSAPPAVVRLAFFPNLTHAQAVMGVESGDFAAAIAPAKLVVQPFNAGPSLIEALFNGQVDIGYVGPGPATSAFARSHGQGIRVIAGAAANGVIIVARPGSGINRLTDLLNKKIATPQHGNTQDIAARHYLISTLKQKDTSNVVPIANADQVGAMSRGDIDAAWSPEPWGSLLMAQAGATLVGQEKDLWPNHEFSLTVVVTTPDFLAAHPQVVEKMLRVHHAWTMRLAADPQKYVTPLEDELASLTGKRLPAGVTAAALTRIKFTDEPLADSLASYAQWGYELGLTPQAPDLTELTDLSILRRILAEPSAAPPAHPATEPQ